MGFGVMCGFRSCCWDEGVSGLAGRLETAGFLGFWVDDRVFGLIGDLV